MGDGGSCQAPTRPPWRCDHACRNEQFYRYERDYEAEQPSSGAKIRRRAQGRAHKSKMRKTAVCVSAEKRGGAKAVAQRYITRAGG